MTGSPCARRAIGPGLLQAAMLLGGAALLPPAWAQAPEAYPAKPIRLIVPFAAGGGTDMVGRVMAPRLAERLGRPVLVENRGGAGAVIGTSLVARAIPDGRRIRATRCDRPRPYVEVRRAPHRPWPAAC